MIFATKIDKSRSINWGLWANWDLIPSRRYSIWHSWRTFVIYLHRRQGTNESLKHLPANPMSWFGNQVGWLFKFSVCCLLVHLLTRYRSNPKSGRQMVHCNKSSLTDLLNPMNQIREGFWLGESQIVSIPLTYDDAGWYILYQKVNKLTDHYDTCVILNWVLVPSGWALSLSWRFSLWRDSKHVNWFVGSQFNCKILYIYNWVSGFSDFKRKKEDERENHKPILKLSSVYD